MPAEALPMALLRPLSGSGALGVAADAMTEHGPDSLIGYMLSTYQGSTGTTFYTLAVYFGAVGVKTTRHTVPACLLADVAGILAATFIVNLNVRVRPGHDLVAPVPPRCVMRAFYPKLGFRKEPGVLSVVQPWVYGVDGEQPDRLKHEVKHLPRYEDANPGKRRLAPDESLVSGG